MEGISKRELHPDSTITRGTYILALNLLPWNVITSCCKQCGSTSVIHRVFHHRPYGCNTDLSQQAISLHSLFWLIRANATRMNGINPWAHLLIGLETWLVVLHAPYESAHKQDLGQLSTVVKVCGTDIRVDFVEGGEGCRGRASSVEIRRLQNEARSNSALEDGQEHTDKVELGQMIDLEMGV